MGSTRHGGGRWPKLAQTLAQTSTWEGALTVLTLKRRTVKCWARVAGMYSEKQLFDDCVRLAGKAPSAGESEGHRLRGSATEHYLVSAPDTSNRQSYVCSSRVNHSH
eukprot:gene13403-19254_t